MESLLLRKTPRVSLTPDEKDEWSISTSWKDDATTMKEEGTDYDDYPATTISYWDDKCGEYFFNANEFEEKYKLFINNLEKYKPREFILDTLSPKICAERLKIIIGNVNT